MSTSAVKPGSTTVVLAGYEAEIDRFHNILIRPEAAS